MKEEKKALLKRYCHRSSGPYQSCNNDSTDIIDVSLQPITCLNDDACMHSARLLRPVIACSVTWMMYMTARLVWTTGAVVALERQETYGWEMPTFFILYHFHDNFLKIPDHPPELKIILSSPRELTAYFMSSSDDVYILCHEREPM